MLALQFQPFPLLSTERLLLRRLTQNDGNEIFLLRSDKEVMKYIDRPLAASLEDANQYLQKIEDLILADEAITWGITLNENDTVIGTMGFWRIEKEHYRAEIGYLLRPSLQGKGIMQDAISAALNYGFKTMKLHSVVANVNPENTASIKLLERNNFIREGYFRENYFYNGKFLDSALYSLLNKED